VKDSYGTHLLKVQTLRAFAKDFFETYFIGSFLKTTYSLIMLTSIIKPSGELVKMTTMKIFKGFWTLHHS